MTLPRYHSYHKQMKLLSKPLIGNLIRLAFAGMGGILLITASLYLYLSPKLPSVETLKEVKLQTPLRIYSQDLQLIDEFGEQRRNPIPFEEIPQHLIQAILAAEDGRFYQHKGVDPVGLGRAVVRLLLSGGDKGGGGGSTITMQVARNYLLTRDQTFTRKFNEILLSFRIEDELTKEDILALYANKMFLGKRAYGIAAAANVYYGKSVEQLSLAQMAMIAGCFQLPTTQNPIANPEDSRDRRNWILSRMMELGYIEQAQYQLAIAEPVTATYHGVQTDLRAAYVSEMARLEAQSIISDLNRTEEAYQDKPLNLMSDGLRVYTTIDSRLQRSARESLRRGLMTYDWRHGYRGPERQYTDPEQWPGALQDTPVVGGLEPAIVTRVEEQQIELLTKSGEMVTFDWEQHLKETRRFATTNYHPKIKGTAETFSIGDLIRLKPMPAKEGIPQWALSQVPDAEAALVALSPKDGAIKSLVGGFDFDKSQYNRVTLAARQPGSNFKPFVYTTALERGMTAATTINGGPIAQKDSVLEDYWRPENDEGKVYGPTRLRKGLYRSLNTVSVRLLKNIGVNAAINGVARFGFNADELPRNGTLALGSHAVPPIQVATGYAAFANGGYLVQPYLIDRIEDVDGTVLYQANPQTVPQPEAEAPLNVAELEQELDNLDVWASNTDREGADTADTPFEPAATPKEAPRIIDAREAFIMDSILKDVIRKGTGRKALVLERRDIAGKTGTTNENKDAWFSGYSPHIVATAWVGFDDNASLGRNEYGGSAALPIWIDFMRTALYGLPDETRTQPDGLVRVRIDPETGKRVTPTHSGAIFEWFRREYLPPEPDADSEKSLDENLLNEELL